MKMLASYYYKERLCALPYHGVLLLYWINKCGRTSKPAPQALVRQGGQCQKLQ